MIGLASLGGAGRAARRDLARRQTVVERLSAARAKQTELEKKEKQKKKKRG